jgi:hypothetical protein
LPWININTLFFNGLQRQVVFWCGRWHFFFVTIEYEPPRKQTANKTNRKGATVIEKDPCEKVCP